MSFFTSGMFWFLEGICLCLASVGLKYYLEDKGGRMGVIKWILFLGWVLFFGFSIAFVGTSIGEGEKTAATIGGLVFGTISLITGVGIWRILKIGTRKKAINF